MPALLPLFGWGHQGSVATVSWPGPRARKRQSQEVQALPAGCPRASALRPGLAGCQVAWLHPSGDPNPDAPGESLAGLPWETPLEVEGVWLASSWLSPPGGPAFCLRGETRSSTGLSPELRPHWLPPLLSGSSCPRAFARAPPPAAHAPLQWYPSDAASSGRPVLDFPPRAGAPFPMLPPRRLWPPPMEAEPESGRSEVC